MFHTVFYKWLEQKYRKILPPVGYYCAYEENACQWGVMALDGKVVVPQLESAEYSFL